MTLDPILFWNEVALEALRLDFSRPDPADPMRDPGGMGPTLSSRAMGLVHVAMYDAFVTAPGGVAPYTLEPRLAGGVPNSVVAVGAAALAVLQAIYPTHLTFLASRTAAFAAMVTLEPNPVGEAEFGHCVATRLLALRAGDPVPPDGVYLPSQSPGRHRVDPLNPTQKFHGDRYPTAKTWAVTQRFSIEPPPQPFTDPDYVASLNEVHAIGGAPELETTTRNNDQTASGLFWAYDGARLIGTPPRLYNQIARNIALKFGLSPVQNAQMFALLNVAMADAGILAWQEKYYHNFWRPVLGIREGDPSLGPMAQPDTLPQPTTGPIAAGDIEWRPFGSPASNTTIMGPFTPNFPAYPSGHATFGAAAFQMIRLFLRDVVHAPGSAFGNCDADDYAFDFVSDELNGVTFDARGSRDLPQSRGTLRPIHRRKFAGLWDAIIDNALSRIYLGVHWSFDAFAYGPDNSPDLTKNVGGVPLGLNIANDIFSAFNTNGSTLVEATMNRDLANRADPSPAPCPPAEKSGGSIMPIQKGSSGRAKRSGRRR